MPPVKKPAKPEPLLKTPQDQISKVEQFKLAANVRGDLKEQFADLSDDSIAEAAEQIAKSHGIYLEYNRAKTGKEKDWMYMVRLSTTGGGSFTREQWALLDQIADEYTANPNGLPSLRLTNRQCVQFHWLKKEAIPDLVRRVAQTGFYTLNGCGDNTRNVMGCPLSKFSDLYNAHALAHKFGHYFQLPAAAHIQVFAVDTTLIRDAEQHFNYGPQLLNRKFKIAFSAAHRNQETGDIEYDNCVELRTNDMGIAPIFDPTSQKLIGHQVYVGGSQGEKNGKPSIAALGKPFGIFTPEELTKGLDAIVATHQEWGDRKNRHWARLKFVIKAQGIEWFRDQVRQRGASFDEPNPELYLGAREMHHGWQQQPSNGKLAYGLYIETGRLRDDNNGKSKTMIRDLMNKYDGMELMITPNQDVLFTNIEPDAKEQFENEFAQYGYGKRNGKPYSTLRLLSGACVGLETCRLAYTESEKFEPVLLDELDAMGFGDVHESIGITGCERQCFRPATKTIGWIGQGPDMYALKLGGSEDGSTQGYYLTDGEHWYLRQTPREYVAKVCAFLFRYYQANRNDGETMGQFHNRIGMPPIIEALKADDELGKLLEKPKPAPYVPEEANHLIPANA